MSTKVKAVVRAKREQAEERQRAHDALSLPTRLAKLDSRPGNSKKERAKIAKLIKEKKAQKAQEATK
jgi:hypothetical protein